MATATRADQIPAPRTIGASKNDILSNLQFFFGDPVVPERLRDYSEQHAATFHFPGAPLQRRRARLRPLRRSAHLGLPVRNQMRTTVRTRRFAR